MDAEVIEATPVCDCDCGCEPDGEWHFTEPRCVCAALGCPCVTDHPVAMRTAAESALED